MSKKQQETGVPKVDAGLVLKHKRSALAVKSKLDDIGMENARAWKAIDDAGMNKKAFKRALTMNNQDPEEAKRDYQLQGAYYEAMNPGVLGSRDLFAIVTPANLHERTEMDILEIEAAGKAIGRKGDRAMTDHQHDPGTEEAQAFERGWRAGNDVNFASASEATGSKGTAVVALRGRGRVSGLKDDTDAAKADLAASKPVTSNLKPNGPKAAPASKKAGPKPAKKMPVGKGANPKPAKPKAGTKASKPSIGTEEVPPVQPDAEPVADNASDVPAPIDARAFDMGSATRPH